MLDLSKYENNDQYADLVAEIRTLRGVADRFAEVSEMMTAPAEPVHKDTVRCGELCRAKAREALEAYRSL